MSFFRNIRSTITRSKSSSRDTSPVRNSRPGSVISSVTERRDSIDSRAESILNRSDTFILNSDQEDKNHSNTSTLEKKSKKSKVLSKFSTFTKRKKTPTPEQTSMEHHPSDNATNTYYKWKTEGSSNIDYDSLTDPFNFLYEQQSSLKSLQNGNIEPAVQRSNNSNNNNSTFDSSTYRKSKMPLHLKEQLEQLKTQTSTDLDETEENESDKYKTVTLNTFRKSFRDKFLQQQKDAPYNPAWFVKVESPAPTVNKTDKADDSVKQRRESKENRPDFFEFENENYRPQSRSPVRDRRTQHASRSSTRSPVKRNETFRVERNNEKVPTTTTTTTTTTAPSIRIEIKNSIAPNMPGRIVPVGVAKPMPSQYNTTQYKQQHKNVITTPTPMTTTTNISHISHKNAPLKTWLKPQTVSPSRNSNVTHSSGRFQTLVQMRNDANTSRQYSPHTTRNGALSTRIQLGGTTAAATTTTTAAPKLYTSATTTRYMPHISSTAVGNYELHKSHLTPTLQAVHKTQKPSPVQFSHKPKHTTYFGDTHLPQTMVNSAHYSGTCAFGSAAKISQTQALPQTRTTAVNRTAGSYLRHYQPLQQTSQQHQQQRVIVPLQRRSRSPIKMPWR
ncbi:probable serine/threonine-protein kinase DDB_G0275165 [Teleopsis dalmanni]|uniref:probable serine/threonine-protein kinase DDB_G0275165 n=1 Tax=Teleopsis dalmanni TaxID=139649 RepID=UPI0018CFA4E1|nr:probable serine/threonine-protein kinase DDB_G0275165 [Teleopsis dalmanni]XP_037940578.1 probable serine/threonine-protein kinase DDB_G0275165 [Teleopsis dalmanni]